jgi:N-glycosylase/DNA lyase
MKLLADIRALRKSPVSKNIQKKLKEFRALGRKGNNEWFSELCLCILTANSKANTAISIQDKLGHNGFLKASKGTVCKTIRGCGHRFHNIKSGYILEARRFSRIKDLLAKESDPRRWLVRNVKGIGWKESSHFLRNVGYFDYALLDRHILALMVENKIIKKIPNLTEKNYLELEERLRKIAKKLKMSLAELDLYMWYMKTGKVLK